jgi:hypothetical protein
MINLAALRLALGNSVVSINGPTPPALNYFGYTPDSVSPPCFFPAEVELDRTAAGNRTFGAIRGYDVKCRILTSRADDLTGQALLDAYLSEGTTDNVVDAIEADQTLGGIAKSVFVYRVDAYRLYTVGADLFYGATLHVRVMG